MKEKPILFSAPMVRAILEGRKTQTRRVVKLTEIHASEIQFWASNGGGEFIGWNRNDSSFWVNAPYEVGMRLWVRETFMCGEEEGHGMGVRRLFYMADNPGQDPHGGFCWCGPDMAWGVHPSIHMPRWASRITLEVTGVRVERVRDISSGDAIAEGCRGLPTSSGGIDWVNDYAHLWDSINEKRGYGWDVNPWVWIIGFRLIDTTERGNG